MVLGQGHCEGLSLDDAVEAELLALVDRVDADDVAELLDDVGDDGRRLRVNHSLRAARKPGHQQGA